MDKVGRTGLDKGASGKTELCGCSGESPEWEM